MYDSDCNFDNFDVIIDLDFAWHMTDRSCTKMPGRVRETSLVRDRCVRKNECCKVWTNVGPVSSIPFFRKDCC